jgi:CheY-like chemotaxis protein
MVDQLETVDMPSYVLLSDDKDLSVVGKTTRSAPPRVLVVDDDRAIRETLRSVLEDEGYTVAEAPDGVVALELLRSSATPLVVLLDLMMPRLDGVGVLNVVARDQQLASRNAYIVITANRYRLDTLASHLLSDLAVAVVLKPFDMDTLLDAVASAMRKLTLH